MPVNRFSNEIPIPPHFDQQKVAKVWKVPYQQRAEEARDWAKAQEILPASQDGFKIALIAIDLQNTFCVPSFELFVAGRSGNAAVEDNLRLSKFIYRNLGVITQITATMDTHQVMQIFHPIFLVDADGRHPTPHTLITYEDILQGRWKFNQEVAKGLEIDATYGQEHLLYYANQLRSQGKYDLTIWPYHAMLGGIGHALVSSIEEALFFHAIARGNQVDFTIKGNNPLTEHYSALGPEVLDGPGGEAIAQKDSKFIQKLKTFDIVIIAGQAKSHCVAWTIADLLEDIHAVDEDLVRKVYLLEDCTSPVVVPNLIDYSEQAEAAFQRFGDAGMHVVRSTAPIKSWPGIEDNLYQH